MDGARAAIGRLPTLILWTVPRGCGTAFELMVEARGDYRIETNVFDQVFYFLDGCGNDPPTRPAELPSSFEAVFEAFRQRAALAPTFLRSAAYTVMNHLDEADWSAMRHCILIRDPRYVLPSHRRFVADITLQEAGYLAQRNLYRHLARDPRTRPVVLDAHELLNAPEGAAARAVPRARRSVPAGEPGLAGRVPGPRWGMWPRWKAHAAACHGFEPFHPDALREAEGRADPLFAECWTLTPSCSPVGFSPWQHHHPVFRQPGVTRPHADRLAAGQRRHALIHDGRTRSTKLA